jgi:glycosyltransferase involved in cell wall biosynthesis
MKVAFVSKSAFSHAIDGLTVPAVVSGHTSQLARALIASARTEGHDVAHVYPIAPGSDDACVVDPLDAYPANVRQLPYWDVPLPKATLSSGSLSFTAALYEAGPLDWVVLLYAFPLAPLVQQFCAATGTRFAALLRGGDVYKWLSPDWWRRVQPAVNSASMLGLYAKALRDADYVAAASAWLLGVSQEHGVPCDDILESPAAISVASLTARTELLNDPGIAVLSGTVDPSRRWLLWAGRASPDKRPDLALDAFERAGVSGWQLLLAAAGPLEDQIASRIDSKRVSAALVRASPRVMPALFAGCDALLHTAVPSSTFIDARPSAVTSAAYHAKPVIAPRAERGGVAESLAPINLDAFGFAVDASADVTMQSLVDAMLRLGDAALRAHAGAANSAWSQASSPDAVWARLARGLATARSPTWRRRCQRTQPPASSPSATA